MSKKIKFILLFSFLIILGFCTKSQARITTSDPTVESGGTATITINSQEPVAYGSINVTSSGGLTFVSVSGGTANGTMLAFAGTENKTSGIATYKFKVPTVTKTTTYKVTFSSTDMGSLDGEVASSSATATVTVKAKSSDGGSSGSSGSSSGNSSSGNSGESSKPQAPSFTTVNETVYATDSVNVRSSYSTSSSIIGSLEKGDSVTRIGKSSSWSKVKYNGQTAYISSNYLTTEKPKESNNKNLKSLTISGDYELTPAFDKDETEYSITIGTDVESLDIKAVAEDSSAKVEISGNDKLLTGENTIEVKVTAEDGTVRTYKINVTKGENDNIVPSFGLSELSIDGYTLSPEFNKGIYEYKLDIEDSSITTLNVNAKSDEKNAVIDISGNNELKLGQNIITILVKSEDGKDAATYQIVVNITEKKEENNQLIAGIDNNDLYMYIGIGGAVLVVIMIIVVIAKRKNRDEDDFETYYGGFNSLDKDADNNNFNSNFIEKNVNADDTNNNMENNSNIETIKDKLNIPEEKKNKKSVIEENFGDGINYSSFADDDKPRRKKGKHSK